MSKTCIYSSYLALLCLKTRSTFVTSISCNTTSGLATSHVMVWQSQTNNIFKKILLPSLQNFGKSSDYFILKIELIKTPMCRHNDRLKSVFQFYVQYASDCYSETVTSEAETTSPYCISCSKLKCTSQRKNFRGKWLISNVCPSSFQ